METLEAARQAFRRYGFCKMKQSQLVYVLENELAAESDADVCRIIRQELLAVRALSPKEYAQLQADDARRTEDPAKTEN